MSLLYLKSQQFIKDNNNDIISTGSELPYHFKNVFKDPIKVTANSTIELISADLNVSPEHAINDKNKNNAITTGVDINTNGFLQKVAKIPDGNYTDEQLSQQVEAAVKKTNNLDFTNIFFSYDNVDKFSFTLLADNTLKDWEVRNTYTNINKSMGVNESGASQDFGVGGYNTTYQTLNENGLQNSHTLFNSSTIQKLTESTITEFTKPPNMISNLVTPSLHGVNNADGVTCAIMSPIKLERFTPATFLSNASAVKFEFKVSGAIQGTSNSIQAYTGSNGYDFLYQYGASNYLYLKMIVSQAELDTFTLPGSVNTKNLPYGHFLIANTLDSAINLTIDGNTFVYMLNTDTDNYFWDFFSSSGPVTSTTFECTTTTYIKSQSTEASLGNWGSSSLSLSRGETGILESNSGLTNQVNTTNQFTRTRVVNTTTASTLITVNDIYADYTIQLTPSKDGADQYVLMNYGTQVTGKVAGETDWLTLTSQTPNDARKLSTIFTKRTLTAADNLIMVADLSEYLCVKFYVGHDTAGNLQFDDLEQIGNTQLDDVGEHAIHLPMNFNESSYPILPVVGLPNPFLGLAKQQSMAFGKYSNKEINIHSLSALNSYMNTSWGNSQTIPTRQPKQTITDYCDGQKLEELKIVIEPNGFNGKSTDGFVDIPDGTFMSGSPSLMNHEGIFRFGGPITAVDQEYQAVIDGGWTINPNQQSNLFLNMGMPKVVILDDFDEPLSFSSTNNPIHNGGQNLIVNLDNFGRLQGQNSATGSISQMVSVIPSGELTDTNNSQDKHFKSSYPVQVKVNAQGDMLVNNFNVSITNDDGTAATSLQHPTNLFLKLNN